MKKNIVFSMCASLLFLASCDYNKDNFPGYDELAIPKDVQNVELSLADGDYKKVAGLESNIKLAASKEDPEGINFPAALEAMGSNKYFTETAPASWYLPAYLESLYPYLSDESKVTVTFNNAEKLPEYLTDFNGISTYELTSGDYKTVWGETVSASFLSPSTVSKIPALLKQAVENPADGAMRMVNYVYSETEPSIGGGGVIPNVYQKVSGMAAEGGNYVFVAPDKEGKLIPFGRLQDETKSYGYMAGTAVTVTDGLISSDVSNYVLTVTPTATGYSLQRPDEKFIYLSGTYNSFNLGTLPAVGGDWKFSQNADGTTSIVNVEKKKTVKLNEYNGSYSYGCYPPSTFGIYLNASMKGSDGDFTFQNIKLEGVTYAWKYDSQNNYWKASAFAGGVNNPTESWLVSTEIDLSGATTPSLSFDAAINFLNGNNRADFIEAKISADYVDNVTTATWATLNATWSEGKNWTFVNSGAIDLKDYVGKKVRLAFAYKSTSACAPTIEIKNISVTEPKNGYYADVYLYKEVPENEVETASAMMFASTRAAAKYNTSAVYRYDAATSTWKEYTTPDVTVAVLQPADYAKMGATYVSKPGETLPIYLKNAYPYAQADLTVAVVYYSSSSQAISATEFVYDGATWMETAKVMPTTMLFIKANGVWNEARVYYANTFIGDEGGCTIQDVELGGKDYVWILDAKYGWKATGYLGGNKTTESWLLIPEINLKGALTPVLRFEAGLNYLYGAKAEDYISVCVSTDYTNDVTTATWEKLEFATWPNSFTFIPMEADFSKYNDKVIRIAIKYTSDATCASTFEVKNFSLQEE